MARLLACADGNWKTAGTWALEETGTGASQTTINNSTLSTTSYVYSSTFTVTNTDVIDGFWLYVERQNTTGTFSVALSDDNGVTATREVTINVSDLAAANQATSTGYFVFFKFGSTLTGDGGSDYRVGIKSSSANSVRVWRDATAGNWSRGLRTTGTQAPAAGDVPQILGERTGTGAVTARTVTMNNDNTDGYNGVTVSDQATLTWATTAASTFTLRIASTFTIFIGAGGAVRMGSTGGGGSRIPVDSVAILEFNAGADNTTGFDDRYGSIIEGKGNPRTTSNNTWRTLLNTDEAAAQTTLGVADDCGWKNGDDILIGSTTRTPGNAEIRTLNADATSTTVTVSSGLTNAHAGTAPVQARVALITRNVIIRSVSTTNYAIGPGALRNYSGTNAPLYDFEWTAFRYLGDVWFRPMIYLNSTAGSIFKYCCFQRTKGQGIRADSGSHGNFTVDNCFFLDCGDDSNDADFSISATSRTDWTFTNNLAMSTNTTNGVGFFIADMIPAAIGGLEVNSITTGTCITFSEASSANDAGVTCDGITIAHCSSTVGMSIADRTCNYWEFRNVDIHVNAFGGFGSPAIDMSAGWYLGIRFVTGKVFGNSTTGLLMRGGVANVNLYFKDFLFAGFTGSSTWNQQYGFYLDTNGGQAALVGAVFENCTFGVVTGNYLAHTSADINFVNSFRAFYVELTLRNCALASSSEIAGFTTPWVSRRSRIQISHHDQTAFHKTMTPEGTITFETTISPDVQPSVKLAPLSATLPLYSNAQVAGRGFLFNVTSGVARTLSVKARKDSSYNGNQPKLVIRANPGLGFTSDQTVDTMSVGADTDETLTGSTPTPTADGVMEAVFVVDGTAGAAYFDLPLVV